MFKVYWCVRLFSSRFPINLFSTTSGICLACSLNCHDKHELIELYTKRNFQCDCGIKAGSVACQLDHNKTRLETNQYNQNFKGLYCKCQRPYPDYENPTNDEMIQCVVCEGKKRNFRLLPLPSILLHFQTGSIPNTSTARRQLPRPIPR